MAKWQLIYSVGHKKHGALAVYIYNVWIILLVLKCCMHS